MSTSPPKTELVRALGRWTLAALVFNGIIGSGIFALPATVTGLLGPSAIWGYVFAALAIAPIVTVMAELGSQYREAGGQYLYARDALGRFAGIQTGWFLWLMRLTAAGAVANVFVTYLGEFYPDVTTTVPRALVMIVVFSSLAWINVRGVRGGARLSNFFTVVKLASLGLFIVAGLLLSERHTPAAPTQTHAIGIWIDALVTLIFAYGGFEAALIPASETKDPRRDVPQALAIALPLVGVVYLLVHLLAARAVPDLAHSMRPLTDAARSFAGAGGAAAITVGVLISAGGWLSVQFVSAPRLTYALAERGDFPRWFGAVHARFRTPHISILVYALLVLGLALYGNFQWNVGLSVAARLITYTTSCAALIRLRRTRKDVAAWRAPAGQVLAVLGMAICALFISRLTAAHALIVGAVAVIATINWLVVRKQS